MSKLPEISTKTGDNSQTSLFSGEKVSKSSLAIKAISKLDLFDRQIGLIYHELDVEFIREFLQELGERLIQLKGEVASSPMFWELYRKKNPAINESDVQALENMNANLKKMLEGEDYEITGWIRYGSEGYISARFDALGAFCREAEISIIELEEGYRLDRESSQSLINPNIKKYINRLSDTLFWVARYLREKEQPEEDGKIGYIRQG